MPRIDVRCESGHVSEVLRPLAMWPETPDCPECGAKTEQVHLPKQMTWTCDPVVVFKAPDGSFRFPGDPNSLSVSRYEKQGFERIELRGAADVRRFETVMNKREYSRAARRVEAMQAHREQREAMTRSELRRQMQQGWQVPEVDKHGNRTGRTLNFPVTERGRAIARAVMSRNDGKPKEYARSVGFHVDVYSNSRSNREESRDAQGRRRRD